MRQSPVTSNPESKSLADSQQALVVLGMHRSGTSALTGALNQCGVWLGSESDLTRASGENPKGFFERKDVRAICDALLHSAGSDWWKIAEFRIDAIPQADLIKCRRSFQDVVARLGRKGSTWAIKEPRLCLLLPVLHTYIPNPVCILIYRNPLDVARSLRVRNGFGLAEGLALWEAYNTYALKSSQGLKCELISYDELISNPSEAIRGLFEKLAYTCDVESGGMNSKAIHNFISPKLHRQQSAAPDVDAFLTPSQQRLWQQLQDGEALDPDKVADLPQATREILSDLEAYRYNQDSLDIKAKEAKEKQRELRSKLAKSEARIAALYSSMSWQLTAPLRAFSASAARTIDHIVNLYSAREGARKSDRCRDRKSQRKGE